MCRHCTLNWLDREIIAIKERLKNAPKGHIEFYRNYIKVLENNRRHEILKVLKGGKKETS